jgi:hypothetical protein
MARKAFETLRPDATNLVEHCTLFDFVDANGECHQASLGFSPVVSSGDPRWVSVMGQISHNETAVDIRWEILGSRPGLARFSAAGTPIAVLEPQHGKQAGLLATSARFALTRLSPDRVLRVIEVHGTTLREEFNGNFRDLSAELRRTACLSAKTVVDTPVELCQVQGTSFNVSVTPTGDGQGARSPQAGFRAWIVRVALALALAIIAVLVVLVLFRRGRASPSQMNRRRGAHW